MPTQSSHATGSRARWLHLTCSSCEAGFRVRRSMLDTGIDCPFCGEFYSETSPDESAAVEVISKPRTKAAPTPEPVAPEKPRTPDPPRYKTTPQRPASAKRKQSIPAHHPVAPRPAANTGNVTAYLKYDPAEPDKIRLKRTERRRQSSTTQRVLHRCMQAAAALAIIAVGILIASSIFTAGNIIARNTNSEAPEISGQKEQERLINSASVLTLNETRDAAETVRACFRSRSIDEMLSFVRTPETVQPQMEAWYQQFPLQAAELGNVVREKILEISPGLHIIMLAMEVPGGGYKFFAVEKLTDGSFKVDWPVSSAYQVMPIEDFISEMPETPVPFRVKAKLSDYYNFAFSDSSRYQCVELYYPGDDTFRLFGYIDKANTSTTSLLSRLNFGPMSLVLNLRYPAERKESDQVEITDLLASDWFTNFTVPQPKEHDL